jgi:hypothetical protein
MPTLLTASPTRRFSPASCWEYEDCRRVMVLADALGSSEAAKL